MHTHVPSFPCLVGKSQSPCSALYLSSSLKQAFHCAMLFRRPRLPSCKPTEGVVRLPRLLRDGDISDLGALNASPGDSFRRCRTDSKTLAVVLSFSISPILSWLLAMRGLSEVKSGAAYLFFLTYLSRYPIYFKTSGGMLSLERATTAGVFVISLLETAKFSDYPKVR